MEKLFTAYELDVLLQDHAADAPDVDCWKEEAVTITTLECGRRDSMDLAFARGVPSINQDSSETAIPSTHLNTFDDVKTGDAFRDFMGNERVSIIDDDSGFIAGNDTDPLFLFTGRRDSIILAQKRGNSFKVKNSRAWDNKKGSFVKRIVSSWQQLFAAKISPDCKQESVQSDEIFDKWLGLDN